MKFLSPRGTSRGSRFRPPRPSRHRPTPTATPAPRTEIKPSVQQKSSRVCRKEKTQGMENHTHTHIIRTHAECTRHHARNIRPLGSGQRLQANARRGEGQLKGKELGKRQKGLDRHQGRSSRTRKPNVRLGFNATSERAHEVLGA